MMFSRQAAEDTNLPKDYFRFWSHDKKELIPGLPDMSVFSHKRSDLIFEDPRNSPPSFKIHKHSLVQHAPYLSPTTFSPKQQYMLSPLPAPKPPISYFSSALPAPKPPIPPLPILSLKQHSCIKGCVQCSGLTNLDIAAFYWSMLAMRGYPDLKARTDPNELQQPMSPPSNPDLTFSKPFSPSDSLSSADSEPLSPTSSLSSDYTNKDASMKCHVCHKSYSHSRLLNRHMQSHTSYKKHHCPRCHKGFNDAFDLKRHIRTHTGIKPFQCGMCEKSFTQRCSLEAHMTRVHNISQKFAFRERRPKLFVCEQCGTTFLDNTKFRQHEKEGQCMSGIMKK
ncbi:transcriptional regulator ovo [Hydra vulgaris]|uniref:Transcriptional regulator ovo n=1 Tax=Hydra vulgaris TaxID=6087 RepID=A0ABM4B4Y8_HYDVU